MGWWIALGILVLLAILPVGVRLSYNEDGLVLSLLLGMVRIKLYPRQKTRPVDKEKQEPKKTAPKGKPAAKEKRGGKLSAFKPLLEIAWNFLGDLRRKIRVKRLEMNLIMAADDPCDLAVNYGKAWAAVGNLMPLLESIFIIKKRNIQVQCDFTADVPRVLARMDVTITVGRIVALAVKYGVPAIREILNLKNTNEGGAVK